MIERDEIDAFSESMQVHVADVQRDYVFGWLIKAISEDSYLGSTLIFKGGNCFRKMYFPESRFSSDLDFATQNELDGALFEKSIQNCCRHIESKTGVKFKEDRAQVEERLRSKDIDGGGKIYKIRIYFSDFYDYEDSLTIAVRMDVSEFEKIFLPINTLPLIHPYSDAGDCSANVRCLAVEELIAAKMKCLLQRRHVMDLFDVAYASLVRNEFGFDRLKILAAFGKKTIFSGSLGAAKNILMGLPVGRFKSVWNENIVCPIKSWMGIDDAESRYLGFIGELFEGQTRGEFSGSAFFPSELRYPLIDAGIEKKLVRLTYDGHRRLVEPYAISYKKPQNGPAQEYLYCFNVEGGNSPPGWRTLIGEKISELSVTDMQFEPREEIELAKSGEMPKNHTFVRAGKMESFSPRPRRTSNAGLVFSQGVPRQYTIQCPYCSKKFKRNRLDTTLNKHVSPDGWPCSGRVGFLIG